LLGKASNIKRPKHLNDNFVALISLLRRRVSG
jgi:hypothetical protein